MPQNSWYDEECREMRAQLQRDFLLGVITHRQSQTAFRRLVRRKKRAYLAQLERDLFDLFLSRDSGDAWRFFHEHSPPPVITSPAVWGQYVTSLYTVPGQDPLPDPTEPCPPTSTFFTTEMAMGNATQLLKEGNMDAVKLEGGYDTHVAATKAIVEAGIEVMGHVGLTLQAISALGGFCPQGQTSSGAMIWLIDVHENMKILDNALALQEFKCFTIVLKCLLSPVATAITSTLSIPTIEIGAGPQCSGQVSVYHDIIGMMQHPHYAKVTPKFCKRYAHIGNAIKEALVSYRDDDTNGSFP
ncbi:hypothetical protein L7F22_062156 [Adiantum nelumboides]|nr:hypothetical protein [Adiantum nelumboides]